MKTRTHFRAYLLCSWPIDTVEQYLVISNKTDRNERNDRTVIKKAIEAKYSVLSPTYDNLR